MVGLFGVVGMAVVQALPRLLWMVTAGVVLSGWWMVQCAPDRVHAGHAGGPGQLVMPISHRVRQQHPELFTESIVLNAG